MLRLSLVENKLKLNIKTVLFCFFLDRTGERNLPHLLPFRLSKFRVALRVKPPRLPTQRASKIRGKTGYHV